MGFLGYFWQTLKTMDLGNDILGLDGETLHTADVLLPVLLIALWHIVIRLSLCFSICISCFCAMLSLHTLACFPSK